MFDWYKNAHICYAYLSDVPGGNRDYETGGLSLYIALEQSRWFTRGWTLQELLAPEWVIILANDWSALGTKASLATDLTAITGITHLFNFEEASVAQKMSWAAHRKTTRLEDRAYSMMGLFDVNMPLLYGEGNKAFIRLQLEILSRSDDESIFAWSNPRPETPRPGLLAETPECFADCGQIRRGDFDPDRPPHFMTNKGLQMQLLLQQRKVPYHLEPTAGDTYVAPLNCTLPGESGFVFVVIYLLEEGGTYSRYGDPDLTADDWTTAKTEADMERKLVHIKQSGHNESMAEVSRPGKISYTVGFDLWAMWKSGFALSERIMWPENESSWNFWQNNLSADYQLVVTITSTKYSVLLRFKHPLMLNGFTIIVGYCLRRPWIAAITHEALESLKTVASSLDKQNAWPRFNYDPRRFQDRVEVDLWYSWFIEVTLQKAGVHHSYGPEKYWVKMNVKHRPEENGDSVHESDSHTFDREVESELEEEAAEVDLSELEDSRASDDALLGQDVLVSGASGDKEALTPSHSPLKQDEVGSKLREKEATVANEPPLQQNDVSTDVMV
jgi:hypothetical protein